MRRLASLDARVAVCVFVAGCATGESLDEGSSAVDAGRVGAGGSVPGRGGSSTASSEGGANTGGASGAAGSAGGTSGGTSPGGGVGGTAILDGGGAGGAASGGSSSGGRGGAAGTGGSAAGGVTGSGGVSATGGVTAAGGAGGVSGAGGIAGAGGSTGGAAGACSTGPNQDADRLTDCQEDADSIVSTSKSVFNGVTASLVANGGGNCTEICLASQIASLFANPVETHDIYSGWEFNTDEPESQAPNSATFGFSPPFTSSVMGWRMLYRGQFWVPSSATGQYCFNVDIGSDGGSGTTDTSPDACGAIYLPDVQANAWVMNGRHQSSTSDSPPMPSESNQRTNCTTFATAGAKRIDFVYQYSNNHTGNRHQLHVKYCYGNAAPCTPTTLIDDTVLTPVGTTIP